MAIVRYILDVPVAVATSALSGDDRTFDTNGDGMVSRTEVFQLLPKNQMTTAELEAARSDTWRSISAEGQRVERRALEQRTGQYLGNGRVAATVADFAAALLTAEPVARQSVRAARDGFSLRRCLQGGPTVRAGAVAGAAVSIGRSIVSTKLGGPPLSSNAAIANMVGTALYEGAAWGTSAVIGGVVAAGASMLVGPVAGGLIGMGAGLLFKSHVLDSLRDAMVHRFVAS